MRLLSVVAVVILAVACGQAEQAELQSEATQAEAKKDLVVGKAGTITDKAAEESYKVLEFALAQQKIAPHQRVNGYAIDQYAVAVSVQCYLMEFTDGRPGDPLFWNCSLKAQGKRIQLSDVHAAVLGEHFMEHTFKPKGRVAKEKDADGKEKPVGMFYTLEGSLNCEMTVGYVSRDYQCTAIQNI